MTSAEDVDIWNTAVELFYNGNLLESLTAFNGMNKSAKIEYNIGFIYMLREEIKESNKHYTEAIKRDAHLAIAHFAIGLNHYHSNRCKEAISSFEQAKSCLRKSRFLDYKQLGLNYQLTLSEILMNIGITLAKQGHEEKARVYLLRALESKGEREYGAIDDALDRLQGGYPLTPVQLPNNAVFRPPKSAVDNIKKKDYLGKPKILFTTSVGGSTSGLQKFKDGRRNLMKDLQQPERKETLKRCRVPPKKPLPTLGKVLDDSKPRSSLTTLPNSRHFEEKTAEARLTKSRISEGGESPPVAHRNIQSMSLRAAPSRGEICPPVPARPPRGATLKPCTEVASFNDVKPECPVKPLPRRLPPPRPESPFTSGQGSGSPNMRKKNLGSLQVSVQFSFMAKITMPSNCEYNDLIDKIKNESVPRSLELCYTDQLGRQHTLSESQWYEMSLEQKSNLKLICFSN